MNVVSSALPIEIEIYEERPQLILITDSMSHSGCLEFDLSLSPAIRGSTQKPPRTAYIYVSNKFPPARLLD